MSEPDTNLQPDLDHFQEVLKNNKKRLMKKANVVDVGIGLKEKDGKPTNTLALIIYVDKKISAKELFVDDKIEDIIDSVPVDIQLAPYVRGGKIRIETVRKSIWGWFAENILPGLLLIVLIAAFFLPIILSYYHIPFSAENAHTLYDYLIVVVLGSLVGSVELISRYRDEPFQTIKTWPGIVYMLLNGLVAAIVLWMIRLFGWDFMPTNIENPSPVITRWTQVIISGLGAMALFRSSFLNLGMGESQSAVGPSAVLDVLLNTVDNEVDRYRALKRAKVVRNLLENIPYAAEEEITKMGIQLMQNIDETAVKQITREKDVVKIFKVDDEAKMYMIGLILMNHLGPDVLQHAIQVLGGPDKYSDKLAKITPPVGTTASSAKGSTGDETEKTSTLTREKLEDIGAGVLKANLPEELHSSATDSTDDKGKAKSKDKSVETGSESNPKP